MLLHDQEFREGGRGNTHAKRMGLEREGGRGRSKKKRESSVANWHIL